MIFFKSFDKFIIMLPNMPKDSFKKNYSNKTLITSQIKIQKILKETLNRDLNTYQKDDLLLID